LDYCYDDYIETNFEYIAKFLLEGSVTSIRMY